MNLLVIAATESRLNDLHSLLSGLGYPPLRMTEEEVLFNPSFPPADVIVCGADKFSHTILSIVGEALPHALRIILNDDLLEEIADSLQLAAFSAAERKQKLFEKSGTSSDPTRLIEALTDIRSARAA